MAGERFVLVAGTGRLPECVLAALGRRSATVRILTLPGAHARDWPAETRPAELALDSLVDSFAALAGEGFDKAVLAGGVARPAVAPDNAPLDIHGGDDAVLRAGIGILEKLGFAVVGAHELVEGLMPEAGILSRACPTERDCEDVQRAAALVEAIGRVDVGQAAVVARNLCIALETVSGTDAMLEFAAGTMARRGSGRQGVLYKAPKPGQDVRVDMPAVGLRTVVLAGDAGLSGIAVEAGAVMLLDRDDIVAEADRRGMFLWARPAAG